MSGQFINARLSTKTALKYEDMTPLQKAKADMDYMAHKGGYGYKQAVHRYKRLLRKEKQLRWKKRNTNN